MAGKSATRAPKARGPRVRPRTRLKVRKGDIVEVLLGSDKGKRGKVLYTQPGKGRVCVQGLNMKWKHLRKSQDAPRGGRLQREQPFAISKVRKVGAEASGE